METKHTPGPLIIEYDEFGGYDGLCQGWHIKDSEGETIDTIESSEANARLFAAAPDLLQACKASLLYLQDDYEGSVEDVFAMLKAAIAKAEGR